MGKLNLNTISKLSVVAAISCLSFSVYADTAPPVPSLQIAYSTSPTAPVSTYGQVYCYNGEWGAPATLLVQPQPSTSNPRDFVPITVSTGITKITCQIADKNKPNYSVVFTARENKWTVSSNPNASSSCARAADGDTMCTLVNLGSTEISSNFQATKVALAKIHHQTNSGKQRA